MRRAICIVTIRDNFFNTYQYIYEKVNDICVLICSGSVNPNF
ncbi:MAG: hypothetical protein JWR38_3837 [Mucilaginibacter sp.]|nr:hypothetical protein [Mucilaginibacter sp.]